MLELNIDFLAFHDQPYLRGPLMKEKWLIEAEARLVIVTHASGSLDGDTGTVAQHSHNTTSPSMLSLFPRTA
jgi:hypothetical protein